MDLLGDVFVGMTSWKIILAAFAGVLWGIIGGALPGVSSTITIALLLPLTYGMDPTAAMVLLCACYVGAEYGCSIPAILIRTPGTPAAAATVMDGYAMHQQGKGAEALGISLMSGVIGGLVGLLMLALLSEPLTWVSLAFTPPAYFALGILGLSIISSVSDGTPLKGLIAAIVGLMIATVGTDPLTGVGRFTYGSAELTGGIHFVFVMVGMFALSELMVDAGSGALPQIKAAAMKLKLPSWQMTKRLARPQSIGVFFGLIEGCLPGGGASVASFLSYNEAKRWSRYPEEFGKGSPEGVAAPEAANNTVASTSLIPTLSFGIPGTSSAAILLGGLIMHGLQPGPMLFEKNDFLGGLYGGLLIANLSQLFWGFVILGPCLWLVSRPRSYLSAFIYALVLTGSLSVGLSIFDLWIVIMAGIVGYVMRWLGFPFLPMILALVLGYMIEGNFRRSLSLSNGDYMTFATNPVAAGLLACAFLLVMTSLIRDLMKKRRQMRASSAQA